MIPDLTVFWVICFVLLLSVVLDRLLFRPLTRVMQARQDAITSAMELARSTVARAQAAAAEFESRTSAVRAEVYREMDEKRRAALERRAALLAETRRDVDASMAEATVRLRRQASEAQARLDEEAEALAASVAERVLGRKVS